MKLISLQILKKLNLLEKTKPQVRKIFVPKTKQKEQIENPLADLEEPLPSNGTPKAPNEEIYQGNKPLEVPESSVMCLPHPRTDILVDDVQNHS